MNKKTKLLALVAVASSLAVGAGAFASSQTNTPSTTTKPATQNRNFKARTGSGSRTDRLVKLSDQLWLNASQKSEFEKLVIQLKTERKAYHEQRKAASTQEAKEKLHLAVNVPDAIDLPEYVSVIEIIPENLPKISIARDEAGTEEKSE